MGNKWEARDKRQVNSQEWKLVSTYEAENHPLECYEYRLINIQPALSELLAVMHGDGGHHEEKVGTLQAIKDAQELIHTKWVKQEQSEVERLREEPIGIDAGKLVRDEIEYERNLNRQYQEKCYRLESKIQELESKLSQLEDNREELIAKVMNLEDKLADIQCKCNPEQKHGETSIMCCNKCGLPTEKFWTKTQLPKKEEQD